MNDLLAWSLKKARGQTLALVEDLREDQMILQSPAGENHPTWILGHLLLSDSYLLYLLGKQALTADFEKLLQKYGPVSTSVSNLDYYDSRESLVARLEQTGNLRFEAVLNLNDLNQSMPDKTLAQTQPTIGHHLQMTIFHEGHHSGQLNFWRKIHEIGTVKGIFLS